MAAGLVRGKWQGHPKEFSYAVRRRKKDQVICMKKKCAGDIKSNKNAEKSGESTQKKGKGKRREAE